MSESSFNPVWIAKPDGTEVAVTANFSIGRTEGNDLVLPDERVSRRHALIHPQGESEYWLVDLGSRNGTYLNGRRVHQPSRLRDQDQIRLGAFVLTFRQPHGLPRTTAVDPTTLRTLVDIRPQPCWLLVADVAGSTPLSQSMPPAELAVLMGQWFLRCKGLIEAAGGTINKYLGDGFLAYWNVSDDSTTALGQLVGSLRQLQKDARPSFRVVVNQGSVLLGGVASLGEESLSGPTVNFTFRMEKLAGSLGQSVLLSDSAASRLNAQIALRTVGLHSLAGFDGQFEFFALE